MIYKVTIGDQTVYAGRDEYLCVGGGEREQETLDEAVYALDLKNEEESIGLSAPYTHLLSYGTREFEPFRSKENGESTVVTGGELIAKVGEEQLDVLRLLASRREWYTDAGKIGFFDGLNRQYRTVEDQGWMRTSSKPLEVRIQEQGGDAYPPIDEQRSTLASYDVESLDEDLEEFLSKNGHEVVKVNVPDFQTTSGDPDFYQGKQSIVIVTTEGSKTRRLRAEKADMDLLYALVGRTANADRAFAKLEAYESDFTTRARR